MKPYEANMAREHILIIDDEQHTLDAIDFLLSAEGFAVGVARDGLQGLEYLHEAMHSSCPVELIITDMQMPGMDGVALLETLRQEGIRVPVLALTAYGDRSLLIELLRLGCSDFLDKPVEEERLLEHVDRMLKQDHHAAERHAQVLRKADVGDHAARIAHDFRNMITSLNGFAELAMMPTCPEDKARHYLNRIQQGCDRATRLTERLIGYGSEPVPSCPAPVNCNRVVAETMELMESVVGRDITVCFKPDRALWLIESNEVSVEQLLMNLLFNARASIEGSGAIMIETANEKDPGSGYCAVGSCEPERAYVRVSVCDNGHGIPLEILPHIFEFGQSGSQSTGLGLDIVKDIVERHKGFVRIESVQDAGSNFHLFLPAITSHTNEGGA